MQPFGDFDIWLNIFCAIVFPLLILTNLVGGPGRSAGNTYLWREEPGLMRVSLVVIGVLSVWSAAQVAVHFGFLTDAGINIVMVVLGPIFLIAGIAEIWLGSRALLRYRRKRAAA